VCSHIDNHAAALDCKCQEDDGDEARIRIPAAERGFVGDGRDEGGCEPRGTGSGEHQSWYGPGMLGNGQGVVSEAVME
jgi:hypothetical protein